MREREREREREGLTSPQVWAVVTSKLCCDSGRASFYLPYSGRQNQALLTGVVITHSDASKI